MRCPNCFSRLLCQNLDVCVLVVFVLKILEVQNLYIPLSISFKYWSHRFGIYRSYQGYVIVRFLQLSGSQQFLQGITIVNFTLTNYGSFFLYQDHCLLSPIPTMPVSQCSLFNYVILRIYPLKEDRKCFVCAML